MVPEQLSGDPGSVESDRGTMQKIDEVALEQSDTDSEFTVFVGESGAEEEVRGLLEERHWWFREEYRDLEATEQFTFNDGEHSIEVFNFSERLTDDQVKEIEQALNDLRSTNLGLSVIDYILISSEERRNTYEQSEPLRGRIHHNARTVVLLPEAMGLTDYRKGQIEGVSEIRATILHESGHGIYEECRTSADKSIQGEWIEKFAQYDPERGINVPLDLDSCVTQYGRHSAHEDFAEGFVAYLTKLQQIREKAPDKLAFMERHIGKRGIEPVNLVRSDRIEYPRVEGVVKYDKADAITMGPK